MKLKFIHFEYFGKLCMSRNDNEITTSFVQLCEPWFDTIYILM